jgi:mono/diheme cytochrome c family protein
MKSRMTERPVSSNAKPPRHLATVVLVLVATSLVGGCGAPAASFQPATIYILERERESNEPIPAAQKGEIADTLSALFGTPDKPHVPVLAGIDAEAVLDQQLLDIAAGPVDVNPQGRPVGLYREHCAHCHGITGDGRGPTAAFLNPYPRDYRMGLFKFKSTPVSGKPTHVDLRRILINGIPGTAMPSFRLLEDQQIEALVHYVRYLAIRGEVERSLIRDVADLDTAGGEQLVDLEALGESNSADLEGQLATIKSTVETIVGKWQAANAAVLQVEERPPQADVAAAVARGRDLFYGKVANCFSCHGDSALGDGQTNLYDDWTKELKPGNPEVLAIYLENGALKPRFLRPRNLREGVYRGGRRPIDIYWRIRNGITGAEMPAAPMLNPGDPPDKKGLTEEDVWCLVEYVRQMPYEPASEPQHDLENLGFTR